MKHVTSRSNDSDIIVDSGDEGTQNSQSISSSPTLAGSINLSNFPAECKTCPCLQPFTKSNVVMTCQRCQQKWHISCHNLKGLTLNASKKLMDSGWKCVRCYISPYVENQERNQQFQDFLRITADITKFNEDLKESSRAFEFFNLHLRRLMIDKEDYVKDSEILSSLKQSLDEVKSLFSSNCTQPKPETPNCEELRTEIEELKDTVKKITEVIIDDHNSRIGTCLPDPAELNNRIEYLSSCCSAVQDNSVSIKNDIEDLKRAVTHCQEKFESNHEPSHNQKRFDDLDKVIKDIGTQLESINQHVCPVFEPITLQIPSEDASDSDVGERQSILMTPNTVSPHYTGSQNAVVTPCEPYDTYVEDAIPSSLKTNLLNLVEESAGEFKSVGGSRDVLYYGEYSYSYTGTKHPAKALLVVMQELIDHVRPHLSDSAARLNSCLITRYVDGNSNIPMHSDDEAFIDPESLIVTVSLGAERTLKFASKSGNQEKSLTPKDSSIYVMSRRSQDYWMHGIPIPTTEPVPVQDTGISDEGGNVRYSLTLRHIAPHFLNSTVIIGDSNTQHIKFGNGFGTLGCWVPGKRIKAAKIKDIPGPEELGPYRNVVIHTGINNLTDERRPSNRLLMLQLKAKLRDIQTVYPNTKLFISLLLPTKSKYVNNRVNELNNLILDMVFCQKNTFIIDNSIFGGDDGCMPPKFGRFLRNGYANSNDIVHLGKEGIRRFCMNIKNSLLRKGRNQSTERFRAGGGNYSEAFDRGGGGRG